MRARRFAVALGGITLFGLGFRVGYVLLVTRTRTWLDTHGDRNTLLDWAARARHTFDIARERDGVWHLWGHSWEIERNQDWARLEEVLDYVARVPSVHYLTNNELFDAER